MTYKENKSFWDEVQGKYKIKDIRYTPLYAMEAGMYITMELTEAGQRPLCPLCGCLPIIHGYKKKR